MVLFQVGRYILASTSAKFNDPESICAIPCDLIFPCSNISMLNENDISLLATNGCQGKKIKESSLEH